MARRPRTSATTSRAGNSGTLSNTLSGAGYSSGYAYTNLGQLWQAPTAGGSQTSQYLYCDSSHPHQLSGIYALGTTCSTRGSAYYSATYDPWGNAITRSFNAVTSTLSYDQLNQMVQWSAGTSQEQYVYDGTGERVLKRSTSGSTTTMTVYAFGLEELQYQGNGTNLGGTSNCYYYSLGGMLIGKFDGTNTTFFMTDGLGRVVASFSNTAGSAAVLGNQTYEPYGKSQYQQGSMGTSMGYTGQYNDNLSGLDYYGARYYDPIAGVFLSPDSAQGNMSGMNPYGYVAGNPETMTDPTGQRPQDGGAGGCVEDPVVCEYEQGGLPISGAGQNGTNSPYITPPDIPPPTYTSGDMTYELYGSGDIAVYQAGKFLAMYLPNSAGYVGIYNTVMTIKNGGFPDESRSSFAQGQTSSPSPDQMLGGGATSSPQPQPQPTPTPRPTIDTLAGASGGGSKGGPPVSAGPPSGDCGDGETHPEPPAPQIPPGYNFKMFGDLIGWGGGKGGMPAGFSDALQRIFTIRPADVEHWIAEGVTPEMAQTWVNTYAWQALYNPKQLNLTAAGRGPLMEYVRDLLSGDAECW